MSLNNASRVLLPAAKKDQTTHVLCYIDLDQFKIVNDKCGHIAGDELLRQIALVLKRSARESDVVARLGGDEFGIIYIDSTIEDAQKQAQRLLNAIGEYRFNYQGNTFGIGASIGMVGILEECCTLSQSSVSSGCSVLCGKRWRSKSYPHSASGRCDDTRAPQSNAVDRTA